MRQSALTGFLVAFVLAAWSAPGATADAVPAPVDSFETVARFLASPVIGNRAVRVDSLVLDVGHGRVRLGPGVLVPATSLAGRTCLAAFVGDVRLAYAPAKDVEKQELRRLGGQTTYAGTADAIVLVACDDTIDGWLASGAATDIPKAADTALRAFDKLIGDEGDPWTGLMRGLLNGANDGYRLAVAMVQGKARADFEFDPREREGSALYVLNQKSGNHVLASQEEAPGTTPTQGNRVALVPENVVVDATIGNNLECRITTLVQARIHESGPTWVPFGLTSDLAVDSVTIDGSAAPFGRRKSAGRVWVRLPAGLDRGMASDLRFVTHGKALEREGDWISLKSSLGWLPQHDGMQRTPYELTFRSPRSYRLVAVGDLVSTAGEGDRNVTRWVVKRPSRNPTFVIGPFDETKLDNPALPPLTVLMSKSMQRDVRAGYEGGEVGGDLSKQTVADLANSQKFFRTLFGDPPDTTMVAAEMMYSHGEAFPGLVNLTWMTFSEVTADVTWIMHMRAHEMAHQWWPMGADFASYHDQWLSEGMADFCALWFAQVSKGDARGYFDQLELWRKDLVPRRWLAAGNPEEASPLSLGWRIQAKQGSGAHTAILYYKRAWVVHMLRALMIDPRTLRDERFAAFLRETYRTYRGRSMSTKDVRTIAEKHFGEELGWFFDQWVDGTAIPTYRWAWNKTKQADGKWKVDVRVAASEVPDGFRMPVLVRLDLGEDKAVRFRVDVDGKQGNSSIEGIELEPKSLVFNDLSGVLCEAKQEPW